MAVAFVFKLCPLQKKIQIIENKIKLKLKYVRRTGSFFFSRKNRDELILKKSS